MTFVPVKKMDRAIMFYTEGLGGKVTSKGEGDMEDSWASLKVGKTEFWLIKPESWEKRELAYNAFVVDDIKAVVADLKKRGVKFSRGRRSSTRTPDSMAQYSRHEWGAEAFFNDSEGNLLMLWESN